MNQETINRFWAKVEKIPFHSCWEWTGAVMGQMKYGCLHRNGKTIYAHRFSYESSIGEIPNGLSVLHKCDNPRCVNPGHLFLGDHKSNAKDKTKKGRAAKKLPPQAVDEILERAFKENAKHSFLAKEFCVSQAAIFYHVSKHKKEGHNAD